MHTYIYIYIYAYIWIHIYIYIYIYIGHTVISLLLDVTGFWQYDNRESLMQQNGGNTELEAEGDDDDNDEYNYYRDKDEIEGTDHES
jgi:hypothetical protein